MSIPAARRIVWFLATATIVSIGGGVKANISDVATIVKRAEQPNRLIASYPTQHLIATDVSIRRFSTLDDFEARGEPPTKIDTTLLLSFVACLFIIAILYRCFLLFDTRRALANPNARRSSCHFLRLGAKLENHLE